MSGPTPFARYPITHTITASSTTYTSWFYVDGYTKAEIEGSWDDDSTAAVVMQGTNAPASADPGTPQPSSTLAATSIFDLVTLTNIAPAGAASTAGAMDDYDNVLPKWIRFKFTESGGTGSTFTGHLVLKSAS